MPDYQNGISKRGSTIGMDTIVLRLADVTDNEISITNTRSIQLTEKERSQYLLDDGDILITRVTIQQKNASDVIFYLTRFFSKIWFFSMRLTALRIRAIKTVNAVLIKDSQ